MSDQDFFFDEEDEKPAKTDKTSAPKAAAPRDAAPSAAPSAGAAGFFGRTLSVGIAALLVVIALLLGVLVGVLLGESRANSALLSAPTTSDQNTNAGGSAPPLSQDQLNSGNLPPGHPAVGSTATASANATGK